MNYLEWITQTIRNLVWFKGNVIPTEAKGIENLLNSLNNDVYILVRWPKSQELMEEDWFEEEAVLNIDASSAYFVPLYRVFKDEKE
jgi:hypothetical protein